MGATIGGSLDCHEAHLSNSSGEALNAIGARIQGYVYMSNGFKAEGELMLAGITIGGSLSCSGAQISNLNGDALTADGARVEGSVFFRNGFRAEGKVRLLGVTIGGNLEFNGANLLNANGQAVSADGARIAGSVFLRNGFKANGQVNLIRATIGGNLECDGAQLLSSDRKALSAESSCIGGHLFLRGGFKAEGDVTLVGTTIGKGLVIYDVFEPKETVLDLQNATVGTLWDEEKSWTDPGNLILDGFRYERLDDKAPLDAKSREAWLRLQPREKFLPQPYEQLAKVLREMGHERESRVIMIEKNRQQSRFTRTRRFRQEWWWYNFFGPMIGYGYRPVRALGGSLAVVVIGALLFYAGYNRNLISPTKDTAYVKDAGGRFVTYKDKRVLADQYPPFTPIVYSVESFTPFLKLDQKENWIPNANHGATVGPSSWHVTTGQMLLWYLRGHIIIGWILTTLWVGAITGLVKT